MSKYDRDNPYKVVRKPTTKAGSVIHGKKYNKRFRQRQDEELIEEGIEDYLKGREN